MSARRGAPWRIIVMWFQSGDISLKNNRIGHNRIQRLEGCADGMNSSRSFVFTLVSLSAIATTPRPISSVHYR